MTRSNLLGGIATSVAMFVALCLTGCSGTIHSPAMQSDSVPVYITDYGKHSSLVLPLQTGGYVEWCYSDWAYHALGQTEFSKAIQALFYSPQATLGRRVIAPQPDQESLRQTIRTERLTVVYVPFNSARALMSKLDARYARHGDTQIFSDYSGMAHVKDDAHYWLFHNCNHVTAQWLREMGVRVDGLNVQSRFNLAR